MKENNFENVKTSVEKNKILTEGFSHNEEIWPYYDTNLNEFGSSFAKTLPGNYVDSIDKNYEAKISDYGEAFTQYIIDTLSKSKNKELYAVEFGGSGSKLFGDFNKKHLFHKTAGVCLKDIHNLPTDKMYNSYNNHSVIEGDILDLNEKPLNEKIENNLGVKKVDLIMSRLMGPLLEFKKNPAILNRIINNWYKMLNENGLIFAQFDYFPEHNRNINLKKLESYFPSKERESEEFVKQWADLIQKKFPNKIEIQLGRGILRLHKNFGAPDELPKNSELFKDKQLKLFK